jgi:hypothetical protein
MLSQFAIIKSYLDERSGAEREREREDKGEKDSFAIALCAYLSLALRGHMFAMLNAKIEGKKARKE